jgi:sulfonate transport system substrate-binding protein
MRKFLGALALATLTLASAGARAETNELRMAKQPGLVYLPTIIMEEEKLIEKHAAAAGMKDFKVSWVRFTSGGASTDALLSDNVDIVVSGPANLLVLWDKTKGKVKGISGVGAAAMMLVTRNPNIHSLADFSEKDRIAVPTVKVSTQAIVLQIAAEKQFGKPGIDRFNALTVALGHPDALIALKNKSEQITSHFSLPPYQYQELKIPGVHEVLNSNQVMGGPLSNAVAFGTTKFHDANPKVVAVYLAALDEAIALIDKDKKAAIEIYKRAMKDKTSDEDLIAMIQPPLTQYSATPMAMMKVADFLAGQGMINQHPKSFKDFFFSEAQRLPGS